MSGREAQAPRERPSGWLPPSFLSALAGGVMLAADSVVAQPAWLVLTALLSIVFGVVVFGVNVWREARAGGTGLVRTSGRALWRSLRMLVSLLFS